MRNHDKDTIALLAVLFAVYLLFSVARCASIEPQPVCLQQECEESLQICTDKLRSGMKSYVYLESVTENFQHQLHDCLKRELMSP